MKRAELQLSDFTRAHASPSGRREEFTGTNKVLVDGFVHRREQEVGDTGCGVKKSRS